MLKKLLLIIFCNIAGCAENINGSTCRQMSATIVKPLDPEYDPNEFKLVVPIYSNDGNDLIHLVSSWITKKN